MKKWELVSDKIPKDGKEALQTLLENRKIKTKASVEAFLHPTLSSVTPKVVGIDLLQLQIAVKRIKTAIKKKEQIVVFGDYDVDGITGTAILWEVLNGIGATVLPYIPHRVDQGYGLSLKGIEDVLGQIPDTKLIITVDNGIVATKAVKFANEKGIDVIITDHHVVGDKKPPALAIVHTTQLCGAGVGWLLSKEFDAQFPNHLELVALATVADLVPLTGANRTVTKFGLELLRKTTRVGLLALLKEAGVEKNDVSVYVLGHIIAPRLNAMGRLEMAMDALRLICTSNAKRAEELAFHLGQTNRERQLITKSSATSAVDKIKNSKSKLKNLIFLSDESYHPGVIGLVAGRLVEEFYRPSIVISIGQTHSKASARSVHGFNIIEFIRLAKDHLVDAGGHPMAAGFTVETAKITILREFLEQKAEELLDAEKLIRVVKIDMPLLLSSINQDLYKSLQSLAPFGMGNSEPTFLSKNVTIASMRSIGKDGSHVKFRLGDGPLIDAIGFGMSEQCKDFSQGDRVDIVYTIDENVWNGNASLQLKIKDIRKGTQ